MACIRRYLRLLATPMRLRLQRNGPQRQSLVAHADDASRRLALSRDTLSWNPNAVRLQRRYLEDAVLCQRNHSVVAATQDARVRRIHGQGLQRQNDILADDVSSCCYRRVCDDPPVRLTLHSLLGSITLLTQSVQRFADRVSR